MSDVIGKATYQLEADARKVKEGVADAEKAIKASGASAEQAFGRTGKSALDKFHASAKGLDDRLQGMAKRGGFTAAILGGAGIGAGLGVFNAVAAGIGKVIDYGDRAIELASDLAEQQSKVSEVFGDQAEVIEGWAKTAVTSMGMSERAALEAAGTLGNLFDALGLSTDRSVEMSRAMIQLAADIGSFNNVASEDVLTALKSGLVGETEPMRRFGANLSAARVNAYALARGMAATTAGITDAIKVQARYELILKDTANAQGNFAKTATGLANSQKSLDAALEQLQTELGKFLVGPAADLVRFLLQVTTGGRTAGGAIQTWIAKQKELAAVTEGSTDPVQNFLDVMTALTQVTDPERVMPAESVKRLMGLGVAANQTAQDVMDMWIHLREGGKSVEEATVFIEDFLRTTSEFRFKSQQYLNAWDQAWKASTDEVVKTVSGGASELRAASRRMVASQRHAVVDMRETIKQGKAGIIEQFRDLAWQSKHPFAEKNYIEWLEGKHDAAMRRAKRAAREGKPGVAAQYRQLAADIRAELEGLPGYAGRLTTNILRKLQPLLRTINNITPLMAGTWRQTGINTETGQPIWEQRAAGGPVEAHRPYLVGERGPEVIIPGIASTVIPNHRLALAATSSRTVRHEHGGTVRIDLTTGAARAMREAGWRPADIRAVAGEMSLADLSAGLERHNRLTSVAYARAVDAD